MSRRPIGDRAMTDAERQRKRRERLRAERPQPGRAIVPYTGAPCSEERMLIAALRQELAETRKAMHVEMSRAEWQEMTAHLAANDAAKKAAAEIEALRRELADAQKRCRELEVVLTRSPWDR